MTLRGVLEPLDTWLAESRSLDEADFYPEALSLFRPMNKPLLAIPQNLSSLVVYYNTEMFENAGISDPSAGWTWDDSQAAAKELTVDTRRRWFSLRFMASRSIRPSIDTRPPSGERAASSSTMSTSRPG